jgi:glycosyltransferase involved in cell wall biosynthesis
MSNTITVAIPSIPPREHYLARALRSVDAQTLRPDHVSVVVDRNGEGAAATRNRAWQAADTEWIAFLDDDDEFLPHHLEHLLAVALETGADLVYPWHDIKDPAGNPKGDVLNGRGVPFRPWLLFGRPVAEVVDPDDMTADGPNAQNFVPITVLVRRELLVRVGGFPQPPPGEACEDWRCWRRMVHAGAKFVHTPEVTWIWHHHGANTQGEPARWLANAPGQIEAPL